jgi:hypothetical protein
MTKWINPEGDYVEPGACGHNNETLREEDGLVKCLDCGAVAFPDVLTVKATHHTLDVIEYALRSTIEEASNMPHDTEDVLDIVLGWRRVDLDQEGLG